MTKITPFLPGRILNLQDGEVRKVSGTLLLSDISGFTSMSEALGEKGKEGTEELSYLLNSYFKGMLTAIRGYSGEVVKFCGDSLLIAFYEEASGEVAQACARHMMKETGKFRSMKTCAGSFDISMKVVGKSGQWNETILGDDRRREHFLWGRIVRDLMSAENRAKSGEILVGQTEEYQTIRVSDGESRLQMSEKNSAKRAIRDQSATETLRHRERKALRNQNKNNGTGIPNYELPTTNHELQTMNSELPKKVLWRRVRSFLPQGVAELVHKESPGEHRAVTTVFLNFCGYDEESPEIESVQQLLKEVISVTERYGGTIHDVDSHSRGSNVMILFGAPISHENDAERAVIASMELSRLSIAPLKVRVGVCTGFVYAGIIGSDWRREYAVVGDSVNTAERLMETAEDEEAVISGTTCSLTLDKIEYKELESSRVKGKEQLLKRSIPLGIIEEKHFRFGFVGREKEMDGIMNAVAQGGKAIIIKGRAGIGKSRLLHEIRKRIEPTHKVLLGSTDQLKGSLHFFTSMIAREADIRTDDPGNLRKEKLEKHIREIEKEGGQGAPPNNGRAGTPVEIENGELYRRIPFLGAMLFGILYPDSLYDSAGVSLRFENLCDAIRYYIEYHACAKSESREARDKITERDENRETTVERESGRQGERETGAKVQDVPLTTTNSELLSQRLISLGLRTTNSKVVVMLDDFQWLKKDAVKIIEYVTRTLLTLSTERDRITFVFSGRPAPDTLDRLPLSEGIETFEFDLSPLPEESTAVLSSNILKNKPLPQDVAEIVFRRTQGNPFYLEQFLLDLIEKGLIRETEEKWVKTVGFREEQ
jgi:class 3 adenylate cyclase